MREPAQPGAGIPRQKGAAIICLEGGKRGGQNDTKPRDRGTHGCSGDCRGLGSLRAPITRTPLWYLEKQVERWRLAGAGAEKNRLAILDGDPFQPLWYGWAYGFTKPHTLNTIISFYRDAIAAGDLAFPDRYILLAVAEAELRAGKEGDASRSRRNFTKHVNLLRHQPRYFTAINTIGPGLAYVLDAAAPVTTLAEIAISVIRGERHAEDSLTVLEYLADWLRKTLSEPEEPGQRVTSPQSTL